MAAAPSRCSKWRRRGFALGGIRGHEESGGSVDGDEQYTGARNYRAAEGSPANGVRGRVAMILPAISGGRFSPHLAGNDAGLKELTKRSHLIRAGTEKPHFHSLG